MGALFGFLLFSLLILVHELGHFLAAKASGVRVNEFSLFMGPAIFKKQVGETLYAVRCIPIGGYCAMEGENEDTDDPRSFQKAAWWKRLIILVAGAFMNFVVGLLIFAILFLPGNTVAKPVITEFVDCCIFNNESGLQLGDEILELDGEKIYLNSDISMILSLNSTVNHDVVVKRGDEILSFDDLKMAHTHTNEDGEEYLHYGFAFGKAEEVGFLGKVDYVWKNTIDNVRNVRMSLQMLLTGKAGLGDMTGMVGVLDLMSDSAAAAPTKTDAVLNVLYIAGFLAINLAVMNMLPIPALDGGRVFGLLLTTAIEAVTRKKLNPKFEGYVHGIGMVLLLALMVLILFKDIFTIFKG